MLCETTSTWLIEIPADRYAGRISLRIFRATARAGRLRASGGQDPRELAQHQRRDHEDVDQIGQQHDAQGGCARPLVERAEHEKGGQRQNRAKQDEPEGCRCLDAARAAPPAERQQWIAL